MSTTSSIYITEPLSVSGATNQASDLARNPYADSLWYHVKGETGLKTIKSIKRSTKRPLYPEPRKDSLRHKRIDSPLNLEKFSDYMTIDTPLETRRLSDLKMALKKLLFAEIDYIKSLNYCLEYERLARGTGLLSEKEELLLFGNIDTISLLSCKLVEDICYSFLDTTAAKDKAMIAKYVLPQVEKIPLGDIFSNHFVKMKNTYQSYCVSHGKQLKLLKELNPRPSFNKWYLKGLEASNSCSLEDLIIQPVGRLDYFSSMIEQILLYSDTILPLPQVRLLSQFHVSYLDYLKQLKLEMAEFANYDYLLTPSEVIGEYAESNTPRTFSELNNKRLNRKVFSSARIQFSCLHQNLIQFEEQLSNTPFLPIIETILAQATKWKVFMELDEFHKDSIYKRYIEKLESQKEQALKLDYEVEKRVIRPIKAVITIYDNVAQTISDHQKIRSDYLVHKLEVSKNIHKVRTAVLAHHFKNLESKLSEELPILFNHTSSMIKNIMLVYYSILLDMMKVIAGGDKFLDKELGLLNSGERELGDNFDIIQLYASSRYYTRAAVDEAIKVGNPTYKLLNKKLPSNGPRVSTSKIVRDLFGL